MSCARATSTRAAAQASIQICPVVASSMIMGPEGIARSSVRFTVGVRPRLDRVRQLVPAPWLCLAGGDATIEARGLLRAMGQGLGQASALGEGGARAIVDNPTCLGDRSANLRKEVVEE